MVDQATQEIYYEQKQFFQTGETLSVSGRIEHLKKLLHEIKKKKDVICDALAKDLDKCTYEAITHEFSGVVTELKYAIKNIRRFSRGKRVADSLAVFPSESKVLPHPKGNVLVFSPWNYPFLLTYAPVISAIAAGNVVLFKPSELTPNTSKVMIEIMHHIFPKYHVHGVEGGVEVANGLLDLEFDHIFFTGSTPVGRIVYEKAAKYLTPVTLELGGKSPCVLDHKVDISTAAKKIAWAKTINAGQTCVAPDYLLIPEENLTEFRDHFQKWIQKFYGSSPIDSKDYTSIVNESHYKRLCSLLEDEIIIYGGEKDEQRRKIAPTLIEIKDKRSAVMTEEIFGPILPIITYRDPLEVHTIIRSNPNPLAMYLFSKRQSWIAKFLDQHLSGGAVINDLVMHLAHKALPFGGTRQSGIGSYHGEYGLQTFSHMRAVMKKPASKWLDLPLRYPPYSWLKTKVVKIIFGI